MRSRCLTLTVLAALLSGPLLTKAEELLRDPTCVWRIPTLSHKSVQNPSLVMSVLIVTMVGQCVI